MFLRSREYLGDSRMKRGAALGGPPLEFWIRECLGDRNLRDVGKFPTKGVVPKSSIIFYFFI